MLYGGAEDAHRERPLIECRDGWFELIGSLSSQLESILADLPESSRFKAVQVKEKFGELRFYVSQYPSYLRTEVTELIERAQKESLHICEVCGKAGEWRSGPPMQVRCWTCFERQKNRT